MTTAAAAGLARGRARRPVGARARAGPGVGAASSTGRQFRRLPGDVGLEAPGPADRPAARVRTPPGARLLAGRAEASGGSRDLSEHSDGQLSVWRITFARGMAWVPPFQGKSWPSCEARSVAPSSTPTGAAATPRPSTPTRPSSGSPDGRGRRRWEQMTHDVADRVLRLRPGYDAWRLPPFPLRPRRRGGRRAAPPLSGYVIEPLHA